VLYSEFNSLFKTEEDAIAYLIQIRYHDGIICPKCGEKRLIYPENNRPKIYSCRRCNNSFSILSGTIFEDTKVSLVKWFYAMNQMVVNKKGISGKQLQRQIGGSYETSWRMLKLIRQSMSNKEEKELFKAILVP
jgi:transposase-like protein